jgi:hypothetical protein
MQTRLKIGAALLASAMVVAGCGGTKTETTSPTKTPTAPVTVSADLTAAITARLNAQDGPLVSPNGSIMIQTAADVRRNSSGTEHAADTLDAAGTQDLTTTKIGNHGNRVVFHFPDAATAMASFQRATQASPKAKTFGIPGVPNSLGTDDTVKNGCGCRYVDFVIGQYEYRLGLSTDLGDSPTLTQFIAMTQAWYAKLEKLA